MLSLALSLNEDDETRISQVDSFIIGCMAYWEAVASFLMNQPLNAVPYLSPFCDQCKLRRIYPNLWAGICTPVLILLAKAGTLSRQQSMLHRLSITASTSQIQDYLHSDLVVQARETEKAVLSYRAPAQDRIEDTGDVLTPVRYLHQLAQIYHLSTLLELYRVFPDLLQDREDDSLDISPKLLAIATSILAAIQAILRTSGVNCLLTIPLLIAGSILQPTARSSAIITDESSWGELAAEILSLPSQEDIYLHWRSVARERLQAVYSHVGMAVVRRAVEILVKVWERADVRALMDEPSCAASWSEFVQWTDVMVEEKLETIQG
jgi:hypothetical protein